MPRTSASPFVALAVAAMIAFAPGNLRAEDRSEDAGAYLAARVAGNQSDYRAAADWFGRALLVDPANPVLLESAVLAHVDLGEFPKAAEVARLLMQTGSKSQVGQIALLADQAKADDYEAILRDGAAGASVGALPDGLIAAWAKLGSGQASDALAAFDGLAKVDGMKAFALYHKALALASTGDFEGADDILSGRAAGPLQVMRRGVIAHAQILSQLERNKDALELLDGTIGAGGDPAIDALRVQLAAGETLSYDIARTAKDGIAEVFFSIGTAMRGEAEAGFTLVHARVAAYLRPDHTDAVLMTAGLLEVQGQSDLATAAYAMIAPSDPAFHVAEIGRADALYATGKKEAAIEVLQALARSNPGILGVQLALGDALRRAERFADAVVAYDAAIALIAKPEARHWPVYYSRAICKERGTDWAGAEADFRQALALEPDQPQVLNYLGYSFLDRNENLDEALGMIERAVAAEPDSGYIIDSLAWALYRLGRYADAVVPMEKASLLEPVDPVVTDHLGDVYWAVGRKLEAAFQWRRAASFAPAEKDAARIKRKLEVGLDAVLAEEGAKPLQPIDAASAGN
jgi:tetratricopeptide (TPR) repeat protein